MQAKDKDKRNFKQFSKRILSGIRRGKRGVGYGDNSLIQELDETLKSKSPENTIEQDVAGVLSQDLEATVSLDSVDLGQDNVPNDKLETVLGFPLQASDSSLNVPSNVDENVASPGLAAGVAPGLGDCMNTSLDSGIDCSILLAEKSSPEQFIAASRREAERIRQEHAQYMNGSVLETLTEAERSSSEESEGDVTIQGSVEGNESCKVEDAQNTADDTVEQVACCDESAKVAKDKLVDNTAIEPNNDQISFDKTENSSCIANDNVSIVRTNTPTLRVERQTEDLSPSLLGQMVINNDETTQNLGRSCDLNATNSSFYSNRNSGVSVTSSMDEYLLGSVENKTDERKSAEARVQQTSGSSGVHIECPHLVVSPVAVRSTSAVAGHKALFPTPTPASLYINENSAFAKCKSIKRSVSDVGKGILGRFRHRKKSGQAAAKTESDNVTGEDNLKYETKKLISGRLKKLHKKDKHKKEKTSSNESVLIVDVAKNKKVDGYCSDTNVYVKNKSPITKEILYNNQSPVYMGGKCESKSRRITSPVVKEVLPDSERRRLSQNLSPSPPPTIEDLTNSIYEMTSRLHAAPVGQSSESIDCICDCKRRSPDEECCDRRKTPTPPGQYESQIEQYQSHVEQLPLLPKEAKTAVQLEIAEDNRLETSIFNKSENCDESVDFDNDRSCDFTSGDETSDNYDTETETDSDGECSDLSCTECSKAAAARRKSVSDSVSSQSSSDSDDEKLLKMKQPTRTNELRRVDSTTDSSSSSSPIDNVLHNLSSNHDTSAYDVTFRELDESPGPRPTRHSSVPRSVDLNFSAHHIDNSRTHHVGTSRSATGYDSPASATGYSNFEESPSAFKEFDHVNGDVMYLGNQSELFEESFFTSHCDTSLSSPYGRLPSETPASSPRGLNSSVEGTPVFINRSQNTQVLSPSQGCRRKDSYSDFPSTQQQRGYGDWQTSFRDKDVSRQREHHSPRSKYDAHQDTSSFRRSYSQNEKVFRSQKQDSTVDTNRSFSKLSRSNSSVDSPNRSFSRSAEVSHRLNVSSNRSFNGLNVSTSMRSDVSFSVENHHPAHSNNLNDSRRMNSSVLCANQSYTNLNSSYSAHNSSILSHARSMSHSQLDSPNRKLNSSIRSHHNESFSRGNRSARQSLSSSYLQDVTSTPPLDLSMTKLRQDQTRHDKWIGQMYSPADRVLHKNRGMSETDLCRQILDLYVSDADESGFEPAADVSRLDSDSPEKQPTERSSQGSPVLQYGKYVGPRNVQKETNVDDFTTSVVKNCYTGRAKNRKIQDGETSILSTNESFVEDEPQSKVQRSSNEEDCSDAEDGGDNHLVRRRDRGNRGEERVRREKLGSRNSSLLETSQMGKLSSSLLETSQNRRSRNSSLLETSQTEQSHDPDDDEEEGEENQSGVGLVNDSLQVAGRSAPGKTRGGARLRHPLRDRTNMPLASSEAKQEAPAGGLDPNSLLEEAQEERKALLQCEKSFDRLTQLYTVHNGRRKVKCLTLNESQNVIKHFPPPKEASRVSWGQTISELDLYRHSPRKTPTKPRPILNQKENNFPYDEDTPSPIVLTKMRKPKSLSKRYKNWPWY